MEKNVQLMSVQLMDQMEEKNQLMIRLAKGTKESGFKGTENNDAESKRLIVSLELQLSKSIELQKEVNVVLYLFIS